MSDTDFFWPLLKPSELATCLSQCQLNVSERDISRPNKDKLMEIYSMLCLLISGDNLEDCDIPNPEALEAANINRLNLYQEGLCELSIYKSITKLMKAAAIPEFSIQHDIYEATETRTVFNLSGLMNFAKFREIRLDFYSTLSQESEELLSEKETLLEYQEQLKEQLEQLREQSEKNKPVLQELADEKASLVQDINDLNRKQSLLREESTRLKAQNKELEDRIESIGTVIETTQIQTSRLRNGIIDKPEQAVALIASLKEKIKHEQKQKSLIEHKNLQFRTKQEQLSKLHKELEKCIELLDKCKKEWDNSKQCNKENKNLQATVSETKQKNQDLQRNMDLSQKQQSLATQRLERSSAKYTEKIEHLKKEKAELESSYNLAVKRVNTELQQKIEYHRNASKEIESLLASQSQEHEIFVSTLQEQVNTLYKELADMHNQILDRIDQFVEL